MNAILSPSAGIALLVDGEGVWSINAGTDETPMPRQLSDFKLLLGDARDVQFVERLELDEIRRLLDESAAADEAMHLALILFDGDLSREVRQEAAAELEELLASPSIADHLRGVFSAAPFPASMDVDGAVSVCDFEGPVAVMLEELVSLQSTIADARAAWDAIPLDVFGSESDRQHARAAAVRSGLFYDFVDIVTLRGADAFRFEGLKNSGFQKVRNFREILKRWVAPFSKAQPAATLKAEDDDYGDKWQPTVDHKQLRQGIDRRRVFENVTTQKAAILRAMDQLDFDKALSFVDELVDYQLRNGGPNYASKSLCDLALQAQLRGLHAMQVALTGRSIVVSPDDGWSWMQHGHALLHNGSLQAALEAYDRAKQFSHDVVAQTGRAEVLKALNRLPDALAAYDDVIGAHPESVFARTGRAEVLKALNRLPDALAAYDDVIRAHPEDAVARTGRAGVLIAMGDLAEALRALPEGKPFVPQEWISYHLRGMILFKMGRIAEAVNIFEFGAANDPQPASREYYRSALALARLRQRDYAGARDLLVDVQTPAIQRSADILRLHAYGALEQFDRAAEAHRRIPKEGSAEVIELTDELRRRYIDRRPAGHDDDWLIDRESLLLIAG